MIIDYSTTIALNCPACGRLERDELNIFALPLAEIKKLHCSCGSLKLTIKRKKNSQIEIDYFCLHCDTSHKMQISSELFWHSDSIRALSCKETGLNPGFFGPTEKVNREIKAEKRDLDLMAAELGFDDFKSPEIMLQALDILDDIAAAGSLSCECGSQDLNIRLFSDKIQIVCNQCGTHLNIPAARNSDLHTLRQLNVVRLHHVQGK